MDLETEKYQEAMFALFRSKGWKYLVEDLEKEQEIAEELRTCRDNNDLKFRQGQLDIIALILNKPAEVERIGTDEENLRFQMS